MKIFITIIISILFLNIIEAQDDPFGIYHKEANVAEQGTQFTDDGFKLKMSKEQKKMYKKQKRLALSPKERALKTKQASGITPLTSSEERKMKKIEKKEKKLEKLKSQFKKDSTGKLTYTPKGNGKFKKDSTGKEVWTPTKQRHFRPLSIFKRHKKSVGDIAADATRGKNKEKTGEQNKLTRLNEKYGLDSLDRDVKMKAERGVPLTTFQYIRYRKALRNEYLLKKKTKKIYAKAIIDMQSKTTQKMMKKRAKENKQRDKKRNRKMFYRRMRTIITFWN